MTAWGLCPLSPGVYRFGFQSRMKANEADTLRPVRLRKPHAALGSPSGVALSSAWVKQKYYT